MTNSFAQTASLEDEDFESAEPKRSNLNSFAKKALKHSAQFWFVVAVLGQWVMVYYIAVHFGGSALNGDFKAFSTAEGQSLHNASLIVHVLLAIIIMGFGPLQLVPQIRARFPKFHQLNGRIYLPTIFISCLAGIYLVWTYQKMPGGTPMFIALNLMVLVIMFCAFKTLQLVLAKKITQHRRWAIRLFMVASAGWFFRVLMMAWIILNGGPVGFDPETFEGPFILTLAFGQYLLPLALTELYFRAQDSANNKIRLFASSVILISTLVMGVGIVGAAMGMWLPNV